MAFPKDLPKQLRGLWKVQYVPREKLALKLYADQKGKRQYRKANYIAKMRTLDRLQQAGLFDKWFREW